MRKVVGILVALVAATWLVASPAAAETQLQWRWDFKSTVTGSGSAVYLEADATDPDAPYGKPMQDTRFVVTLPPGARIDTSVPARCSATDDQLKANGLTACPTRSRVGRGTAASIVGVGPPTDPVEQDIYAFNGRGTLIMVVTARGEQAVQAVLRARIRRDRIIDVAIPQVPSPAGGTIALTIFHLKLNRVVRAGGGAAYITTPSSCPRSRRWRIVADIDFVDGSRRRVSDTSPCRRPRDPSVTGGRG